MEQGESLDETGIPIFFLFKFIKVFVSMLDKWEWLDCVAINISFFSDDNFQ